MERVPAKCVVRFTASAAEVSAWSQMFSTSIAGRGAGVGRAVRTKVLGRVRLKGALITIFTTMLATTLSVSVGVTPASAVAGPALQVFPLAEDTAVTGGDKVLIEQYVTLQAGESRRVIGQVQASPTTLEWGNPSIDFVASVHCVDPAGQWSGGTLGLAQTSLQHGRVLTQRPAILIKASSSGVYRCKLLAGTNTAPAVMTTHAANTYLAVSAADEVGSHQWQNPDCNSPGDWPTCRYLGTSGGPKEIYIFGNDGTPRYEWTAANNATAVGVTANVELTTCGHTASCNRLETDPKQAKVSSRLEVIQLDPQGNSCKVTVSNERIDEIGIIEHHYNMSYDLPSVPVLVTCGGLRKFLVRVHVRWISGTPVKIDGTRPDGPGSVAYTTALAVNSSYAPATATVPSVVGLSQTAAQNALTAAQLNVGTITTVDNVALPGTVLAQNAPAATVEPIKSPVNLTVSLGMPHAEDISDFTCALGSAPCTPHFGILNATGGTPGYTWSITGLPRGSSLNPATGAISGTITQAGTSTVAYTVTDAAGRSDTKSFKWTVTPMRVNPVSDATNPRSAPTGNFWGQFTVANGLAPYTWTATGLPTGLTLDTTSGGLWGAPTTAGAHTVTYTATDTHGNAATSTFKWNITAPVPHLSGKTTTQANSAINGMSAGLIAQRDADTTVFDNTDQSRVVRQNPAPGTQVLPGQVVQYSIGRWNGARQ